ncbi:MAG TPA: hypothetical protein VFK66_01250 [Oryzihumus sp.]|nr:hypothetical protein [Oryzihumus sp.]
MGRWARVSMVAAGLAMLGNLAGLVWAETVYGREVPAFVQQAVAQDVVDLLVVGPALVVLAAGVLRGSDRAWLLWLGALAFTVYNYVIYAFTLHVGRLSLLWIAVLGLSVAALGAGLHRLDPEALHWSGRVPRRTVGIFLVVVGALFALLWLSELLPAVVHGTVPRSARELGLPANPVHVLDLAFFLPAVIAAGVMVLRRRPLGLALAPGLLVFLLLTGLPILLTPVVATVRGEAAAWAVVVPIGVLTLVTAVVLGRLVSTLEVDPARGRRA